MVGTWQPLRLSVSEPDGVVTNRKMKLLGWEKISSLATSRDEPSSWDRKPEQNPNLLVRERGWMPARILPCAAVGGEIFLLTSPFIEHFRWLDQPFRNIDWGIGVRAAAGLG